MFPINTCYTKACNYVFISKKVRDFDLGIHRTRGPHFKSSTVQLTAFSRDMRSHKYFILLLASLLVPVP